MVKNLLTLAAIVLVASIIIGDGVLAEPVRQAQVIQKHRITVNATGTAGNAGGNTTTSPRIVGKVIRVDVDFAAGITTTTDLTLAGADDLLSVNVVDLSNTATDTTLYPQVQVTDNAGTGLTYDGTRTVTDYYPVNSQLTATITQTTAATPAVTIDVYTEGRP